MELDGALARAGMARVRLFEITATGAGGGAVGATGESTRSAEIGALTRDGEPAIVLTVPDFGCDTESVVLYTDEAGVSRWIFPEGRGREETGGTGGSTTRGGSGGAVFHLPRNAAPLPVDEGGAPGVAPAGGTRGPLAKIGRRIVRVIAWAAGDVIGQGVAAVVGAWERHHRPYAVRPFTPEGVEGGWPMRRRRRCRGTGWPSAGHCC